MRFIFLIFFPIFLIVLGVYGAGSSLPIQNTVIRGISLPISQNKLWKLIIEFDSMAEWHQNIEKVIAVPAPETQKTLWHISTASNQSYILVPGYQSKPDVLKVEWLESHLSYDVKWKMSLMDKTPSLKEQAGDSPVTFIKITEVSKTPNPFARFFMQYFLKYEASVEDYLQNLARHLEVPEAEIRELVT